MNTQAPASAPRNPNKGMRILGWTMTAIGASLGALCISLWATGAISVKYPSAACAPRVVPGPNTPPTDLIGGSVKCAQASDYESAAYLFALGMTYARADTLRVPDRAAHQVVIVLPMALMQLSADQQNGVHAALKKALGSQELCAWMAKRPPPAYPPKYMSRHGMRVFAQPGSGAPVPGVISNAKWDALRERYLHCPAT